MDYCYTSSTFTAKAVDACSIQPEIVTVEVAKLKPNADKPVRSLEQLEGMKGGFVEMSKFNNKQLLVKEIIKRLQCKKRSEKKKRRRLRLLELYGLLSTEDFLAIDKENKTSGINKKISLFKEMIK